MMDSSLYPLDTLPHYRLKQRLLKGVQPLLYWSGVAPLFARLRSGSIATILMYHSITNETIAPWIDPYNAMSEGEFAQQMRFLSQRRNVISLHHLVTALKQGKALPRGTVVITFDDGYLDNLTLAAPILARYDLPATIFLATHYVNEGQSQWIDTLYGLFRARSRHQLQLGAVAQTSASYGDLRSEEQSRYAYQALVQSLITATVSERDALLSTIEQQLAPTQQSPRLTMTWEDVRSLRAKFPLIELGIHTANHIDLTTHPEQIVPELACAFDDFQREINEQPHYFAYPYNRHDATTQQAIQDNGFAGAVSATADPVVRPDTNLYALPRVEASQSMTTLRLRTGGAFPDLSQRLFGRAWVAGH